MSDSLVPGRFLFRFSVPCLMREPLWTAEGAKLDQQCRLPSLAELEGRPAWADVRAAWSPAGLAFAVRVSGKQQPPWCRASRPEDSDGLQVWIDTRDVHNVHRAGRFCHRFIFLPRGGDHAAHGARRLDEPVGQLQPIHRAREQCRPVQPDQIQVRSQRFSGGYLLEAFLPAEALTGFDPQEHPRLGFTYAVLDRQLGEQTLGVGSPMPYQEDPSFWATLELRRKEEG
ncbi:MAG: hypothetical protein ABSG86_06355 [Thermoguttaceae bacterium]|jgi:hypothetical protein